MMPINVVDQAQSTAWWLGIHGLLSVVLALTATAMLKSRYPKQAHLLFALFVMLALAMPLVNVGFVPWLAYYFKAHRHDPDEIAAQGIDLGAFMIRFPVVRRTLGEGIASFEADNDAIPQHNRLLALTLLSDYRNKAYMATIKQMLKSHDDELRLLSFSVIDRLEQTIHANIHAGKQRLETLPEESDAWYREHQKLAEAYWELIYFELADDTLKRYLADRILMHVSRYESRFGADERSEMLLAKTAFSLEEYSEALRRFWNVVRLRGVNDIAEAANVVPYIAEIYYHQGKYEAVQKLMKHAKKLDFDAKMKSVRELWAA